MRILLCCEFYYPSIGGVQAVIQQLAEHFVEMGHFVTVATTRLPSRQLNELNGVHIKEFSVFGNLVSGMKGEVKKYRDFVQQDGYDIMMVKAAQQWTFDALWPVLDQIKSIKVFIPTGFSGLYEPAYSRYFQQLPDVLRKIDHLIFFSSDYRDINFVKKHGFTNYSIIPNGASEVEFSAPPNPDFRHSLGIGENDILLLTVGSFTGLKGHMEVAKAFEIADFKGKSATLILNGNKPANYENNILQTISRLAGIVQQYGVKYAAKHSIKTSLRKIGIKVGKDDALQTIINAVKNQQGKTVMITDLPRPTLIQAFIAADLFVFASNVEYSPLVLFESAAAGTPFITVPVGNSEEITHWTGAGMVCPAVRDAKGYTRVEPYDLAQSISQLALDQPLREKLSAAGKRNWKEKFTWEKISRQYESIFFRLLEEGNPKT